MDLGGGDAMDLTPLRLGLDTAVDEVREGLGLAPISSAMARRRVAADHLRRAAEYVALRATATGATAYSCGCCGERVAPPAPARPAARLEGWLPWGQGYI
uniref:Uncharacterized protein n=1 Tax=Leersia perrieri TaxID=77586 RepID=A0A0D9XF42_9ORYZ